MHVLFICKWVFVVLVWGKQEKARREQVSQRSFTYPPGVCVHNSFVKELNLVCILLFASLCHQQIGLSLPFIGCGEVGCLNPPCITS